MKPGARLAAAVEVVDDVLNRYRPAATALADWGKAHRFAGSGDRSAIGNVVYDVLRKRLSLAARMEDDSPRALVIAAAHGALAMSAGDVEAAADGSPHALQPLSVAEQAGLRRALPDDVAAHVRADVPEWMFTSLQRGLGDDAVAEGRALAERAPVDLRVNTLKASRAKVLDTLARFHPEPTPLSPLGIRLRAPEGGKRAPNVEVEPAHGKGWFEVQDEGSQIAALLAGAGPRQQVLDLCAGAGGKTLALGAVMQNTGQIYAYDRDRSQLRPIFERVKRADLRSVQMLEPGNEAALLGLGPRFDLVMVDAPCTGSGTWRRRPDAKWRVKPGQLEHRISEQRAVLELARHLVKPGGRLAYVTCSLMPEENTEQVAWFREQAPEFGLAPYADIWREAIGGTPPQSADGRTDSLLLTPRRHGTDGFFVAILIKR